MQMSSN